VPPAPMPPVRQARRALIDSISATLRERYLDPVVAERMIESLHQHWERGDYDSADDGSLAQLVRADLRAVSHDEHLGLFFGAGGAVGARGPGPGASGGSGDRSFGFGPSQRLSGNVALLPIFNFVPANEQVVEEAIADFLTEVADAAALIIDLRDNNGGRAPTVALVISYLLDGPPVHQRARPDLLLDRQGNLRTTGASTRAGSGWPSPSTRRGQSPAPRRPETLEPETG
jgi:retinol-binding protein 3